MQLSLFSPSLFLHLLFSETRDSPSSLLLTFMPSSPPPPSSSLVHLSLRNYQVSVQELLQNTCGAGFCLSAVKQVVVYGHGCLDSHPLPGESFLSVLLDKLTACFERILCVEGGFESFQLTYAPLCAQDVAKRSLTALSQPCLSSNAAPTRILPFLWLGSESDCRNVQMLRVRKVCVQRKERAVAPAEGEANGPGAEGGSGSPGQKSRPISY